MHKAQQEMVELLVERGLLDRKRVVPWDVATTYYAETLYFAGELGYGPSTEHKWDSLRVEHCSWAMALPRTELQRAFTADYVQRAAQPVVMVVDRSDAGGRRSLRNHANLMATLRARLGQNCTIRTFLGKDVNTSHTVTLWGEADVVVAPHGAALAFMAFMRPGRAAIEIGYDSYHTGGMPYPLSYFMAIAKSVGLDFYLSMARGGYGSPLQANIGDVVHLVEMALSKVELLPVGAKAW